MRVRISGWLALAFALACSFKGANAMSVGDGHGTGGALGSSTDGGALGGSGAASTEAVVHTDDAGCTWTGRLPFDECFETSGRWEGCVLAHVWELRCPNDFGTTRVVTDTAGLHVAYSAQNDAEESRLVLARIADDSLTTRSFEEPTFAELVSSGRQTRALSYDVRGVRSFGEDEVWAPLVDGDPSLLGGARMLDDGTLAFLTTGVGTESLFWLGEESTPLAGALLPTSAGGVLLGARLGGGAFRLSHWLAGEERELAVTPPPSMLLERDGTVLWATSTGAPPLGRSVPGSTPDPGPSFLDHLHALGADDTEPHVVFESEFASPSDECAGQQVTSELCPANTAITELGAVLALNSLGVVTWDGRLWLGRVQAGLVDACTWQNLGGCTGALPCDCSQRNARRFDDEQLVIAPLDAPDDPVVEIPVNWYGAVSSMRLLAVEGRLNFAMVSGTSSESRRLSIYELALP